MVFWRYFELWFLVQKSYFFLTNPKLSLLFLKSKKFFIYENFHFHRLFWKKKFRKNSLHSSMLFGLNIGHYIRQIISLLFLIFSKENSSFNMSSLFENFIPFESWHFELSLCEIFRILKIIWVFIFCTKIILFFDKSKTITSLTQIKKIFHLWKLPLL